MLNVQNERNGTLHQMETTATTSASSELNPSKTYNIADTAQLLGVSTATVRNWIRLGNLYPDASDKQFSGAYLKSFISSLRAKDSAKLKSRRIDTPPAKAVGFSVH